MLTRLNLKSCHQSCAKSYQPGWEAGECSGSKNWSWSSPWCHIHPFSNAHTPADGRRSSRAPRKLRFVSIPDMVNPSQTISDRPIGSCQFPTLGFVVDRYFRVKRFVPEKFWSIQVVERREDINVTFSWRRHRLFDRVVVIILFERCLTARTARVSKVQKKPTSKWRPLPLTTVELQKLGSMFLRMDSQRVMKVGNIFNWGEDRHTEPTQVAEDLYTKGWISYPRTETDSFDKGIDLRRLVEKQVQDQAWGPYAQGYTKFLCICNSSFIERWPLKPVSLTARLNNHAAAAITIKPIPQSTPSTMSSQQLSLTMSDGYMNSSYAAS